MYIMYSTLCRPTRSMLSSSRIESSSFTIRMRIYESFASTIRIRMNHPRLDCRFNEVHGVAYLLPSLRATNSIYVHGATLLNIL